jgi:hypothetical protein
VTCWVSPHDIEAHRCGLRFELRAGAHRRVIRGGYARQGGNSEMRGKQALSARLRDLVRVLPGLLFLGCTSQNWADWISATSA